MKSERTTRKMTVERTDSRCRLESWDVKADVDIVFIYIIKYRNIYLMLICSGHKVS